MFIQLFVFFLNSQVYAQEWSDKANFRVHKSCIETFGDTFATNVVIGIEEGLTCLSRLSGECSEINHARLLKLLAKQISITCHEDSYFKQKPWSVAYASKSEQSVHDLDLHHPYISFNRTRNDVNNADFLKTTSFHEVFHLVGYEHGKNEEYAYACEECCFGKGKAKEQGCQLCQKKFDGLKDPDYIRSFMAYLEASEWRDYFRAPYVIRNGLFEAPQSVLHRESLLLIDGSKNYFSIFTANMWSGFESEVISNISQGSIAGKLELESELLRKAFEARESFLIKKDLEQAIQLYQNLPWDEYKAFYASDNKNGLELWTSLLTDFDSLIFKTFDEEHPDRYILDELYKELKSYQLTKEIKPKPRHCSEHFYPEAGSIW